MLATTGRGQVFAGLRRAVAALGAIGLAATGAAAIAGPATAAVQIGSIATVSPHDTISGTSGAPITFTAVSDTGPINAVRIVRPSTLFTVLDGSAANWTATASPDGYETFTGFVLAPGETGTFVVDIAVGQPTQDTFGYWTVLTSSDGGNTYQVAQGQYTQEALAANIRVLSMTHPAISPSENNGTTVTEGEQVSLTTTVTNDGTGTVQLNPNACAVTGVESGDVTSPGTYVGTPAILGPGQSATVELAGVGIGSNTGTGRHLRMTLSTGDGRATQAMVDVVTIGTPAPYISSAVTGNNGSYNTINIYLSEPVTGTENVNNWRVVDNQGVAHPVFNVTGSPSAYWILELSPTPGYTSGWTATVTYTPGDLHDKSGNALPQTTVEATSGTST